MQIIRLEKMEFYAFHGCYAEERKIGTRFLVTVELHADLTQACTTDQRNATIDYEAVYNLVKTEMQQPSNLIEHVAWRIKQRLLVEFAQLQSATVELSKMAPALGGKIEKATVVV